MEFVDYNGNNIVIEETLFSNNTNTQHTVIFNISHSVFDFKELVIYGSNDIIVIVPILANQKNYSAAFSYSNRDGMICIGTFDITFNSNTQIQIYSPYIAHQFNASHPDQSSQYVYAVLGRYV